MIKSQKLKGTNNLVFFSENSYFVYIISQKVQIETLCN